MCFYFISCIFHFFGSYFEGETIFTIFMREVLNSYIVKNRVRLRRRDNLGPVFRGVPLTWVKCEARGARKV